MKLFTAFDLVEKRRAPNGIFRSRTSEKPADPRLVASDSLHVQPYQVTRAIAGQTSGGLKTTHEGVAPEDFVKLTPRVEKTKPEGSYYMSTCGRRVIILLAEEVLASGDWRDDPLWTHGVSIGVGA